MQKSQLILRSLLAALLTLTFACEGPSGSTGADGTPGEAGPQGADGADGADGVDGVDGVDGIDGTDGNPGNDGMDGANGADSACANVDSLEISAVEVPAELYEFDSYTVTPETNAADASALRFTVAGSGLPVSFVDNEDGSFTMNTGAAEELNYPAYYSVTATDGCSIATATISLQTLGEKAATINVLNLTDSVVDVIAGVMPMGATENYYSRLSYASDYDLDQSTSVKAGMGSIWVYNYDFGVSVPEDYEEEDFIVLTEGVNFELNKTYVIVVSYDENGNTVTDMIETAPSTMEETFNLSVSHYGVGAGPVDVIDLDATMVLIDDLALGTTTDALELPTGTAFNLGLDVDQDGVSDFDISIAEDDFLAGDWINISAYFEAGELTLGVTVMNAEGEFSFGSIPTGILAPPPPPMTTDELSANLPYASGSYSANEAFGLYDPSTLTIQAPDGAASITITLDHDTEGCCDDLVVLDIDGNEVLRTSGEATGVEVVVPGNYALIGIDSDFGLQYSGYTITAISVQ